MDVIEHFSCHTKLPIKIQTIREHVMETAKIDKMSFFAVDIDPAFLAGMLRLYRFATHVPAAGDLLIADIFYSKHLQLPEMRVVCTKEMIHAADGDAALAKTKEQVDRLIEEVVIPPELARSIPGRVDGNGLLYALAVLLPRDALSELRPAYRAGRISVEDIAKYAIIPESYARFALSEQWELVVENLT